MVAITLTLVIGILALIAAGAVCRHTDKITFQWLKNKIKEKFTEENIKKVAVADIKVLMSNCDNKMTLANLEKLSNEGYTHFIATINDNDEIIDVELIKDENTDIDEDVERFINNTGEGMVVVEN